MKIIMGRILVFTAFGGSGCPIMAKGVADEVWLQCKFQEFYGVLGTVYWSTGAVIIWARPSETTCVLMLGIILLL